RDGHRADQGARRLAHRGRHQWSVDGSAPARHRRERDPHFTRGGPLRRADHRARHARRGGAGGRRPHARPGRHLGLAPGGRRRGARHSRDRRRPSERPARPARQLLPGPLHLHARSARGRATAAAAMTTASIGVARPRALSALGRTAVAVACLALIGWNAALVLVMERGLVRSDFGKLHASARAYLAGRDMYDLGPATLSPVRGMGGDILHYIQFLNLNPPHFHLILLPLAPLPGRWALLVWALVSLACLRLSLRLILPH